MLLHDSKDFSDLLAVVARDQAIDPGLVEKDYWIMHGLWGLQQLGFAFELKGGTSLSKGYGLIHRFSDVKRRSKGTPDRRRRGTPFSDNMMLVC